MRVEGVERGRIFLFVLVGSGLLAAGCSANHPDPAPSPPAGRVTTATTATTATAATTLATAASAPPATALNPGDCQSGPVAVAVSLGAAQRSVCLRTGATLTVVFDKSGRGGMGLPEQWATPLLRQDQPILSVISTSPRGSSLTAVLKAETPGSTTVYANYEEGCSAATTTPCTVPPLGMLGLDITVVAS